MKKLIKQRLFDLEMSQKELAEHLGVHKSYIGKFLTNDEGTLSLKYILKIAEKLDIPISIIKAALIGDYSDKLDKLLGA